MAFEQDKRNKLYLYIGPELSELQVVNRLVPGLLAMGIKPVLGLVAKRSYKNPNSNTPAMKKLGFYHGDLLQKTVVPFLDANKTYLDARGGLLKGICYTPRQLAEQYGLDIERIEDVNSEEHRQKIESDNSVFARLSVRCTHIFSDDTVEAIRGKGQELFNIHPGAMPGIRGVLPIYRALERGDLSIEWSFHSIEDGRVDMGTVHGIAYQDADRNKASVFSHYNDNPGRVADMALGVLKNMVQGNPLNKIVNRGRAYEQPHSFPCEKSTDAFNEAGGTLVESAGKMIKFYGRTFAGKGSPLRRGLDFQVEKAIRAQFDPPPPPTVLRSPSSTKTTTSFFTSPRRVPAGAVLRRANG